MDSGWLSEFPMRSIKSDKNYTVVRKSIKKNPSKESYKGLTYEYMREYIESHSGADRMMKLFNGNIRTIEVDLSDLVDDFSEELIKKVLVSGEYTNLIYSPKTRDIYAKRILCDRITIHRDVYHQKYVKHCPITGNIAYLIALGKMEFYPSMDCMECDAERFRDDEIYPNTLFCLGKFGDFGDIDYSKIDRIVDIVRENETVQFAELIIDGKIKTFGKKRNQQ